MAWLYKLGQFLQGAQGGTYTGPYIPVGLLPKTCQ